jgi:hypothetical protein
LLLLKLRPRVILDLILTSSCGILNKKGDLQRPIS